MSQKRCSYHGHANKFGIKVFLANGLCKHRQLLDDGEPHAPLRILGNGNDLWNNDRVDLVRTDDLLEHGQF